MSVIATPVYQNCIEGMYADTHERLYILTDTTTNIMRYALLVFGPDNEVKHMTAYLNLPKEEWLQVSDQMVGPWSVTFEGVESQRVSVKNKVDKLIPVTLHSFWIGIDWMGFDREISWEDAIDRVRGLCDALNRNLIKAEIDRVKK